MLSKQELSGILLDTQRTFCLGSLFLLISLASSKVSCLSGCSHKIFLGHKRSFLSSLLRQWRVAGPFCKFEMVKELFRTTRDFFWLWDTSRSSFNHVVRVLFKGTFKKKETLVFYSPTRREMLWCHWMPNTDLLELCERISWIERIPWWVKIPFKLLKIPKDSRKAKRNKLNSWNFE